MMKKKHPHVVIKKSIKFSAPMDEAESPSEEASESPSDEAAEGYKGGGMVHGHKHMPVGERHGHKPIPFNKKHGHLPMHRSMKKPRGA